MHKSHGIYFDILKPIGRPERAELRSEAEDGKPETRSLYHSPSFASLLAGRLLDHYCTSTDFV
jgi:hypothetical protein